MKKLVRKQSLYVTLGIIIVSIIALITLFSSAYIYIQIKDRLIDDMERSSVLSIESLKENVTNLVASYSENEYINLISNEMQHRGYFAIIVEDDNMGKVLGKPSYFAGKIRDSNGIIIEFDAENAEHIKQLEACFYLQKQGLVTYTGQTLGAISICTSDQHITEELNEIIGFTVLNALAISLFMVLLLFLTIRNYILKPISNITNIINNSDEDGIPLEEVTEKGSIEISSLSNTINSMIGSIKGSRKKLREQHKQLKIREAQLSLQAAAMRAASDAIVIMDIKGEIIWVNPAFEELTGYLFHEIQGNNVSILKSGMQDSDFYQALWETILSGKSWFGELQNKRKDGSVYLEEENITPVQDETGEIIHFVSIKRDITLQRQKEMQLQRSQKMDALGKLTGGVAHDYNNMLGVIMGYAELLESSLSDQPDLAKYAYNIFHAGERGAKLTRKLLSFSRKQSTSFEITNINTLLKYEQDVLEKTLTVSIKLEFDLADELWPVWIDSSDLEDAIINMCINAMHAMPDGGQLTLSTANHQLAEEDAQFLGLAAGDYVMLMITDTGAGMDKEIQRQIFDPFFTTKGEVGTGLGLSQVYSFTQRAKGAIKVFSEDGEGSRFVLYFPRYCSADYIYGGNQPVIPTEDWSGNEAILVVDDESELLNLTHEVLSKNGYRVLCANGAEQALNILQTETVDLLLSDVIMPNMDGYQLAAKVLSLYPAIKIQLTSGFSDNRNHDLVSDELHRNILYKPYNSLQLLQCVRTVLDTNK